MAERKSEIIRKTKETDIRLELNLGSSVIPQISTGLPFFDHILYSMAFHGGFFLRIEATGDIDVDPHHLVEDTGLVFGEALKQAAEKSTAINRFGHFIIPMDASLSEATIDVCGRPNLVYRADYPQTHAGDFDISLIREFLKALTDRAGMTLHAECRYGENSHHMVEALFKAIGKSIGQAYTPHEGGILSTKGSLSV